MSRLGKIKTMASTLKDILTALPSELRKTAMFVEGPLEVVSQQQECVKVDWGKLRIDGWISFHRRTIRCPEDE